jgi:hypothetical protein
VIPKSSSDVCSEVIGLTSGLVVSRAHSVSGRIIHTPWIHQSSVEVVIESSGMFQSTQNLQTVSTC